MSEASERLSRWCHTGEGENIDEAAMAVLGELHILKAESLEWLRIARGIGDAETNSDEETKWFGQLEEMRRGRGALDTPVPIVDQLLAERDAMHEGQKRLTAIYVERGRTIEMMRNLMNATH